MAQQMEIVDQTSYSLSRSISLQTINGDGARGHKTFLSEAREKIIDLMIQNTPCKIELVLKCTMFNSGTHKLQKDLYVFRTYSEYVEQNTDVSLLYSQMMNQLMKAITNVTNDESNREIHSIDWFEIYTIRYTFENADNIPVAVRNRMIKTNMSDDDSSLYFGSLPQYPA